MDGTIALFIGGLTTALLVSFKYIEIVIKSNAKDQKKCMEEIRKRDKLLVKLGAKMSKVVIAVKHYRRLAEKEAEFNQRLLKILTDNPKAATISETTKMETVNEPRNTRKPQ